MAFQGFLCLNYIIIFNNNGILSLTKTFFKIKDQDKKGFIMPDYI